VNTPARKVPSHGTHFLGQTFAIDFVKVDRRRRTATVRDWRTVIAIEPLDRFLGFGDPILAPANGRVVTVHDGEEDHAARRSPLTVIPVPPDPRGEAPPWAGRGYRQSFDLGTW
jgi:hypothetical protein